MKIKILSFAIFCVLFLGFSFGVNAQICGPSITKIYVRDNQGNIIKHVKFKFMESDETLDYLKRQWLLFDNDAYTIFFGMDRPSPEGSKLLKISVEDFETTEQRIYFRQPQYQIFNLTLKRKGTQENVDFEELIPLKGFVADAKENNISEIKVILKGNDGKKYKSLTNER